ncbi:tyrosine-type recombinase/integrase [Azonexus sp. IMCC34842]|uniref:tyrosine-type recombinase/integrase n=1 Tax=Azonexus sp. IMCC34842 TaxID=3420950 RepID=UPI003D0C7F8B
MPLTDTTIRSFKPADKPKSVADERGLSIHIQPNGSKWWRFRYRYGGVAKMLSLGVYPDVGLKDARDRRDAARKMLADGIDPGATRKASKAAQSDRAANSFEVIAREWLDGQKDVVSEGQQEKTLARMENDVFPWLGVKAMADISAPDILSVLRRIDERGARYTAHRCRGQISQVFRYAIATGRAERDPCPDLKGAIPSARSGNFASITEPAKVGEMLRSFDAFSGTFVVKCALEIAPRVFVRPGELRKGEWAQFDLDKAEWRYFVTKTKTEHIVPLASQVVTLLRELHALTGHGRYVYPGRDPKKPMSEAAINAALRRLGYDTKTEITGHGFRAMARTILHEELHIKPEIIEHQLAHTVPDALGTAYNRTKFLKERKVMMQLWADYLDKLKTGADVIPLQGNGAK